MAKLSVEIITGERVVYEENDVDMVVAPGADGSLGLLPSHAPLFSLLSLGEMRVIKGGQEQSLAVFGGFLEIANDHVRVLADSAERAEEIDAARAEEARQRAETYKTERGADADMLRTEAAMRRSMVRLKLARRQRNRSAPGGPGSRQPTDT